MAGVETLPLHVIYRPPVQRKFSILHDGRTIIGDVLEAANRLFGTV